MPFHVVKQGETLIGLAARHGFADAQALLDLPENAELKAKRPDPGVLKAGDRVFVPSRRLQQAARPVNDSHGFTVRLPTAWLRLALKDSAGKPWAGKAWVLEVGGRRFTGELAADGILEQQVPAATDSAELRLFVAGAAAAPEIWQLAVGHLDPAGEVSGVQARLSNLGLDPGPVNGELSPETGAAVRALQRLLGEEETGAADAALSARLASLYDPAEDEQAAFRGLEASEAEEPLPAGEPIPAQVQLVAAPGKGGDTLRSRSWIEVELLGEDGKGIPGAKVEVEAPGGRRFTGVLDSGGRFRATGFPAGLCRVTFPDLDKDAWVPLAPTAEGPPPGSS